MFEEIDSCVNSDYVPSNISYKSFKTYRIYLYRIPTVITETSIVYTMPLHCVWYDRGPWTETKALLLIIT
jgi:hypothetical protein